MYNTYYAYQKRVWPKEKVKKSMLLNFVKYWSPFKHRLQSIKSKDFFCTHHIHIQIESFQWAINVNTFKQSSLNISYEFKDIIIKTSIQNQFKTYDLLHNTRYAYQKRVGLKEKVKKSMLLNFVKYWSPFKHRLQSIKSKDFFCTHHIHIQIESFQWAINVNTFKQSSLNISYEFKDIIIKTPIQNQFKTYDLVELVYIYIQNQFKTQLQYQVIIFMIVN